MKPINEERKEELEERLGHKICPFAAEKVEHIEMFGVYRGAEEQTLYYCSKDGNVRSALGPCSAEKAETCPTYRRSREMLTQGGT